MSRDLGALFEPRSVAVVGASADPSKWGNALARGALRGEGRRPVYLVNRSGGEILGRPAHRSLAELPGEPELVVVSVPAAGFEAAVDDALAVGARAIVAISAGLGEAGEEGRRVEEEVAARVRAAGAAMLGPNCLGVFDAAAELDLGWSALPSGPIGLVSQSGNLALELARLATAAGLGFSRFASLGNQADLVAADLVAELARHEGTRLIALYLEDFRDGRAFVDACAGAGASGKPVVLLTGGSSQASARAALSHTGALVSGARAIEAACRAGGIVSVATPKQLVDAAQALLPGRRPAGRRVAVYCDGGGHGVVAADVLDAAGLDVPRLSPATTATLGEHLPETASLENPVDFAGGGERGLAAYAEVGRLLLAAPEVDAVLLTGYFGGYGVDTPELAAEELAAARDLAAAAAETNGTLAVHTSYPDSAVAAELRGGGVPVYGDVESAAAAIALLAGRRPEPSAACVDSTQAPARTLPPPTPGYVGARAWIAAAGIPFAEARPAHGSREALAAAAELGYPVALKAAGLLHKSDRGGVVLGIADDEALLAAAADLSERLGAEELSVERMAPLTDGVELIVGARRDPRFGPLVLVGLGGVFAEVLDDVAVALAPVTAAAAEGLIRSLRGAPLLEGARGRPPLDVAAAAAAVAAVSRAVAGCALVAELDVNPLLVLPQGCLALDARIVSGPRP